MSSDAPVHHLTKDVAVTKLDPDPDPPTDRYFILKSFRAWRREVTVTADNDDDDNNDAAEPERVCSVQPVMPRPCDYEHWRFSPLEHQRKLRMQKAGMLNSAMGETMHGRRFNDVVELFDMEDGKETPGLREQLERFEGLTVRSWVPEPLRRKGKTAYPGFRFSTPEKSFVDKCQEKLRHRIQGYADAMGKKVPFALLADPGRSVKGLLVIVVGEEYFEAFKSGGHGRVILNDCSFEVVGVSLSPGKTELFCDEAQVVAYFQKDGEPTELRFFDHEQTVAEAAKELEKREKKAAKKNRRQQQTAATSAQTTTASEAAATNGNDVSDPSMVNQRDSEEQAEKKREKLRAKKKAQRMRKKEALATKAASSSAPASSPSKDGEEGRIMKGPARTAQVQNAGAEDPQSDGGEESQFDDAADEDGDGENSALGADPAVWRTRARALLARFQEMSDAHNAAKQEADEQA